MKYLRCLFLSLILVLLLSVTVFADNTSWNKVTINQSGVGHSKGCTVCTLQLMLQNSQTVKSEYQLSGNQSSSGGSYSTFDTAFKNTGAVSEGGDGWVLGSVVSGFNSLSNATWSSVADGGFNSTNYNSLTALTGLGDKDFKDMSASEQLTCAKTLWNGGYWVAFCVEYKGTSKEKGNGTGDYKANHATMLAGVDETTIWLNDPANGSVRNYADCSNGGNPYNLVYVLLFKNDKSSPLSLAGGQTVDVTDEDNKNAGNIGIDPSMVGGYYTEDQLSAYLRLNEVNIQEMFLDGATREALTQDELSGLANWQLNTRMQEEEHGVVRLLRTLTMFIGILLIVYSLLLYTAYWIDKTNAVIPVEMLSLLTFGKLHVAGDEEDSTFSLSKEGVRSVNHRNIISICIICIGAGFLLITGLFYSIVAGFVNFVLGFLR